MAISGRTDRRRPSRQSEDANDAPAPQPPPPFLEASHSSHV